MRSCAAVAITINKPVENLNPPQFCPHVNGCGDAGIVIVAILVPLVDVPSYSVTTPVATGLLNVIPIRTPSPVLTIVPAVVAVKFDYSLQFTGWP